MKELEGKIVKLKLIKNCNFGTDKNENFDTIHGKILWVKDNFVKIQCSEEFMKGMEKRGIFYVPISNILLINDGWEGWVNP